MADATRADLAVALYNALGLDSPTSTGAFSDGGANDGIYSTLADLGITVGVGEGRFGGDQVTTRGQAFTMIARALGLAPEGAGVPESTQALVDAGIVKGYANGDIGMNDPLRMDQLGLLVDRLGPELARPSAANPDVTIGDTLTEEADTKRDESLAEANPAFAAYLRETGLRASQIDDELALRESLFTEDSRRRSDTYARALEDTHRGIGQDFENRGLTRSGTHLRKRARATGDNAQALGQAQYDAQRGFEQGQRDLGYERQSLDQALQQAREKGGYEQTMSEIDEKYGNV